MQKKIKQLAAIMFEYLEKAFDQRIGIILTQTNPIWKTIH